MDATGASFPPSGCSASWAPNMDAVEESPNDPDLIMSPKDVARCRPPPCGKYG
jgi:hypothetical protein